MSVVYSMYNVPKISLTNAIYDDFITRAHGVLERTFCPNRMIVKIVYWQFCSQLNIACILCMIDHLYEINIQRNLYLLCFSWGPIKSMYWRGHFLDGHLCHLFKIIFQVRLKILFHPIYPSLNSHRVYTVF